MLVKGGLTHAETVGEEVISFAKTTLGTENITNAMTIKLRWDALFNIEVVPRWAHRTSLSESRCRFVEARRNPS